MGKTQWQCTMSLDGFIAGPGGDPGGTNVKLERLSLTHAPQATNLWLRVVS